MHAIYQAVRAIANPRRDRGHNPASNPVLDACPSDLRLSLICFEGFHRGHAHLLKLLVPGMDLRATGNEMLRRQYHRIQQSAESLARQLLKLDEPALPQLPQIEALLDAQDTSGMLEPALVQFLSWQCDYATPGSVEIHSTWAYRGEDERLRLEVKLPEDVVREFVLPAMPLNTLRNCMRLVAATKELVAKELANVQNWPEFSEEGILERRKTKLQAEMACFLKRFDAEDRAFLAKHWDAFRPKV